MNDYNILAEFIAKKYEDRISGKDLANRIIGENPKEHVMTGLLAEDRVEKTFDGKYKENEETKYESVPSIGIKFNISKRENAKIKIVPKGLLFYAVKPTYEEVVNYFLEKESAKDKKKYTSINELAEIYEDENISIPLAYEKIELEKEFSNGFIIDIHPQNEVIKLKRKIQDGLDKIINEKINKIKIIKETSFKYKDLLKKDLFGLVCPENDDRIYPGWQFDIDVSISEYDAYYNVFVRMVNLTSSPNRKNTGYLPQIYDAGLDIYGIENVEFQEIKLDYFANSYKNIAKCYSVAENASSEYIKEDNCVKTTNIPVYNEYRTKTDDRYNTYILFDNLINRPIENLQEILKRLKADLDSRKKEYQDSEHSLTFNAREKYLNAINEYENEIIRFQYGIEQIKYKSFVQDAFILMNKVFSTTTLGDKKTYKGWRLFQIVFIVSLICDVIASEYKDDQSIKNITKVETADLLYFPTGGGKTEAFLGISVFTMIFDRLRGKDIGVTGILKYPLRLLAVQQLERVLTVIMKANIVLKKEPLLKGKNEFSLGFYIGSSNTPNKIYENDKFNGGSEKIIHGTSEALNESYRFIDRCPVCGEHSIQLVFDSDKWMLKHVCTNKKCDVETLPLYIIDNEIYRYLPTLIVSTVDKMAALGFSDDFKHLMGEIRYKFEKHGYSWRPCCPAKYGCKENYTSVSDLLDPIPTLFIQDEMHLVKESLGTFDAHYESFIKYYASNLAREQHRKKIKFIGATATISMYEEHIRHLYHMRGRRFPCEYPSCNADRNFYSYIDKTDKTRIILGFAPYGRSITRGIWESVYNMRVLISDIRNNLADNYEKIKLLGFNGDMATLENMLYDYWINLVYNNRKDDVINLDSSLGNQANDRLKEKGMEEFVTAQMTSDNNFQEVRKTLFDIQKNRKKEHSVNTILATSTISHGVDEDAFNNMFFYGMPNTNAEYIQAYSRSGRKYTGLVVDIIRLLRIRDRSYLKNFLLFHQNKDELVENVPINRWAKNAIYNTLPGILSGLLLQYYTVELNTDSLTKVEALKKYISDERISISDVVEKMIAIYGCSQTEKLSINYENIIKKYVKEIIDGIKVKIFDNNTKTTDAIKSVYSKHLGTMTSLRDTEETIEVSLVEK